MPFSYLDLGNWLRFGGICIAINRLVVAAAVVVVVVVVVGGGGIRRCCCRRPCFFVFFVIFMTPFTSDALSSVDCPLLPASFTESSLFLSLIVWPCSASDARLLQAFRLLTRYSKCWKTHFCPVLLIWRSVSPTLFGYCCWFFFS